MIHRVQEHTASTCRFGRLNLLNHFVRRQSVPAIHTEGPGAPVDKPRGIAPGIKRIAIRDSPPISKRLPVLTPSHCRRQHCRVGQTFELELQVRWEYFLQMVLDQ